MQKLFCRGLAFSLFALVSVHQAQAFEPLNTFRSTGEKPYTVHGAFRDLVVKTALHDFVNKHLPNQHFFNLGSTDFNAHDVFNAFADAVAEVIDGYVFEGKADYINAAKLCVTGTVAHKLFVEVLTLLGVTDQVSDEVQDNYNRFGKAWFSRALAESINNALDKVLPVSSSN